MHIAVCDDHQYFLDELCKLLDKLDIVRSASPFSTTNALISSIELGAAYDAVIMDIEFEQSKNGIDIAEELYNLSPESKIVYVTGHRDKFVQQVFLKPANLSGYMLKPVDEKILYENLQKISNEARQRRTQILSVQYKGEISVIPISSIRYIESAAHKISIYTENDLYTCYEKLDSIVSQLPPNFVQCHKSYVVNMDKIQRMSKDCITLSDGQNVAVSKSRYTAAKEQYFSYIETTL